MGARTRKREALKIQLSVSSGACRVFRPARLIAAFALPPQLPPPRLRNPKRKTRKGRKWQVTGSGHASRVSALGSFLRPSTLAVNLSDGARLYWEVVGVSISLSESPPTTIPLPRDRREQPAPAPHPTCDISAWALLLPDARRLQRWIFDICNGSCPQIRALLIGPLAAIECPWLHSVALTAIGTAIPRTVFPFYEI